MSNLAGSQLEFGKRGDLHLGLQLLKFRGKDDWKWMLLITGRTVMDVGQLDRDRLYDLYTRYHARLRADVVRVNRSLGSATPDKTRLEMLERPMFDSLVDGSANEPDVVHRFMLRIVRGHEQEFPEFRVA